MEELIIIILLLLAALMIRKKYHEVLYHSEKERLIISSIILISMISWELVSVHTQVWLYPGPGTLGIFFWGLPIELFAFYLVLPYFVFTVFELIHKKMDRLSK